MCPLYRDAAFIHKENNWKFMLKMARRSHTNKCQAEMYGILRIYEIKKPWLLARINVPDQSREGSDCHKSKYWCGSFCVDNITCNNSRGAAKQGIKAEMACNRQISVLFGADNNYYYSNDDDDDRKDVTNKTLGVPD